MRRIALKGLLGAAMLALVGPLWAGLVQIDYTGTVSSLTGTGDVSGTFAVGDSVSGQLIYSTAAPEEAYTATGTKYPEAIQSFVLTIGTYTGAMVGTTYVYNDDSSFHDGVVFYADSYISGDPVNGLDLSRNQLSLTTAVDSILGDSALPSADDIALLWANNVATGGINFMSFGNIGVVRYRLDTVVAREIDPNIPLPVPVSLWLVIGGMVTLGLTRKDRQRRSRSS